jgi:hypothetical protein
MPDRDCRRASAVVERLTPTAVACLRFLAEYRTKRTRLQDGAIAAVIADAVSSRMSGWTTQAAARWIGLILRHALKDGYASRRRPAGTHYEYDLTHKGVLFLRSLESQQAGDIVAIASSEQSIAMLIP